MEAVGEAAARAWLLARLPERAREVVVSWDARTAAMVPWGVFCDHRADFCYPASDDVTVWPLAGEEWLLEVDHDERMRLFRREGAGGV